MKKLLFLAVVVLFISVNAEALTITEIESNDTLDTAQMVDGYFSLGANPDIAYATTSPWVSITGTGDGTFDYYQFTVNNNNDTIVIDIDYGHTPDVTGSVELSFGLYKWNGSDWINRMSHSGYSPVADGAGGSVSESDPYFEYSPSYNSNANAGLWAIGIASGKYIYHDSDPSIVGFAHPTAPIPIESTYQLQLSIENAAVAPVPEPTTLALMGLGLASIGWKRRKAA